MGTVSTRAERRTVLQVYLGRFPEVSDVADIKRFGIERELDFDALQEALNLLREINLTRYPSYPEFKWQVRHARAEVEQALSHYIAMRWPTVEEER